MGIRSRIIALPEVDMAIQSEPMPKAATSELVIEREFDAPVERVWDAWTDPGQMKRWWGPKVFTAPVVQIDLRVGGKYLACMRDPSGKDYWSTGVYREIVPRKRIVATDSFADEKGNVVPGSHYGMSDDFPLEMLLTVDFAEVEGRTRLSLRHDGMPNNEQADMARQGWNESLDKLADMLREG
jgi:uncharacterized protein YndB with AHSA1/START domain